MSIPLKNTSLAGINPDDPDLPDDVKKAIAQECTVNPMYFYSIVGV